MQSAWFVISHNPVLCQKNIRCINTYIMNDGASVFLFRDRAHARYVMQSRLTPDHFIVAADKSLIDEYREVNRLCGGVKIVESLFCDVESRVERLELCEVGAFEKNFTCLTKN